MSTPLWFRGLVAAADAAAWLSSRYDYKWEPSISVSLAICRPGAPSRTTMYKVMRYAGAASVFRRHGLEWRPWPKLDELHRIGELSPVFVDEYAQLAEYIATNMDQRRRPAVDGWARRAALAAQR